jgi:hypothetical protein
MKKVSFDLNREEKNRILEMHQKSTGRQYLNLIKEENQQLNEIAPLIWWALGGAAVIYGGIAAYNWEGTDANKSVKALHDSCEKSKLGKPIQPNSEHEKIANEVHEGISGLDFSGDGEKKLASALSKIKSIPDYCKVASEYQLTYGADMYEDIDGDINFGGWDEFVRVPLSAAVKATEKANNEASNTGGGGEQPGDGEGNGDGEQNGDGEGTPSSNDTMTYKSCSGTYGLGCKDDDENVVWQLQGCLGVKQTGKFGPNTESALREKTGNKTIDEREVWTLCKDEDPGDKLF